MPKFIVLEISTGQVAINEDAIRAVKTVRGGLRVWCDFPNGTQHDNVFSVDLKHAGELLKLTGLTEQRIKDLAEIPPRQL